MKRAPRVSLRGPLGPRAPLRPRPHQRQGPVGGMKSPHEGPTASKMSLHRPRGPYKFIVASLAIDILSRDRFREEIPFPRYASAVRTSGYRFVGRSPAGLTGWRGSLARGAYWPHGRTWPRRPPWLRPCITGRSVDPVVCHQPCGAVSLAGQSVLSRPTPLVRAFTDQ